MRFFVIKAGERLPYFLKKDKSSERFLLEINTTGMEETPCPVVLIERFIGDTVIFYQEKNPTNYMSVLPIKENEVYEASASFAEKILAKRS